MSDRREGFEDVIRIDLEPHEVDEWYEFINSHLFKPEHWSKKIEQEQA